MLKAMLEEAWHAMGANRLRTFLTMLGMVIGVGAVVLMISVGQGARYAVNQTISTMGSNLFILGSGSTTSGAVRGGASTTFTLKMTDGEAIAELDNVEVVAPYHHPAPAQAQYGANNWKSSVVPTVPEYLDCRAWNTVAGRPFSDSDVRSATTVAMLGWTVAQKLFGDNDPIGEVIRIQGVPFSVLGVLAPKGQSLDGRDQDDTILIPLTTYQRKLFGSSFRGSVQLMMVQAVSSEAMPGVEASIRGLLRQRHRLRDGMADDFSIRNLTAVAESAAETTRVMSLLLGAIASISLLVGGIGIMNIMLVSVTERTREIGIRLAIGAREQDILLQFLLEAIIISVVGCCIGVVLGVGGALLTNVLTGTAVIISGGSVMVAFAVAAGVGVFFGFYPARKAARLDPIESLRYQ
jgi:putative ABC transport system permease protein